MSLSESKSKILYWVLNSFLGAGFVAEFFVSSAALEDCVILLAAVASIAALLRQLPLQNVLTAAAIVAVIGGAAHGLSAIPNLSLPFGPIVFNTAAGAEIFNFVPWTIPLIWIIAVFNARGVGRLILRPWRKVKNYGFWLIGLTVVLAVAFDVALEPFARHVKHLWIWQPTRISITWHGATPLNFLAWACVSLLMMLIITPWLIRKQPGNRSNLDLHPLMLWLGALILFAVDCAEARLWAPVAVDAVIAAVTTIFAVRGLKW